MHEKPQLDNISFKLLHLLKLLTCFQLIGLKQKPDNKYVKWRLVLTLKTLTYVRYVT